MTPEDGWCTRCEAWVAIDDLAHDGVCDGCHEAIEAGGQP